VFVNPVIRNLGVYIHSFVERIVSYCEGFPSSWYLHPFMQVGILSRVLEEVDKIVQEFKEMLYKKMEDPHVEISQVGLCIYQGSLLLLDKPEFEYIMVGW
jgi:hypothetical protein